MLAPTGIRALDRHNFPIFVGKSVETINFGQDINDYGRANTSSGDLMDFDLFGRDFVGSS